MKLSLSWLKEFVPISGRPEKLGQDLTMAGLEVKKIESRPDLGDIVLETEITSNRPDWLSHIGVAREIAAIRTLKLKLLPQYHRDLHPAKSSEWSIEIRDKESCPYYTGVYIGGIKPADSPEFIRKRLEACGIRSIDFIVDITNYVLLETGQPLHTFDADKIRGKKIIVRKANPQEKFTAINGVVYELKNEDIVIADAEGACALGGVMGGKESEIQSGTKNIFLESAFFNPPSIRKTSRRLGLSSESSYRFERRVNPEGVDWARNRALNLICQYAGPETIGTVLLAGKKPTSKISQLKFSSQDMERTLGFKVPEKAASGILGRLGFQVKRASKRGWQIKIPSFRSDVTSSVDLVEEVARIYGYDKIPEALPSRVPLLRQDHFWLEVEDRTHESLTGLGFHEAITFSLISKNNIANEEILKKAIYVQNPQNKDLCVMRPTFLPSLLQVIRRNVDFGSKQVLIYELANLYQKPSQPSEKSEARALGIAIAGKWNMKNWVDPERNATFYDLKGVVEHLLSSLGIPEIKYDLMHHPMLREHNSESLKVNSKTLGFLGEVTHEELKMWDLEFEVFYAEIGLDRLREWTKKRPRFREIPKYPSMERDIAICVPESTHSGELEQEIRGLGGTLVAKVELFDLYRGGRVPKGFKNLAYRITYQSPERTLVSEDIQKLHSRIAESLAAKHQASFQ